MYQEQFTADWDDFTSFMGLFGPREVNRFIGKGAPKPEVAGNFGMHSNVYQVGVTVRAPLHVYFSAYHSEIAPMTPRRGISEQVNVGLLTILLLV